MNCIASLEVCLSLDPGVWRTAWLTPSKAGVWFFDEYWFALGGTRMNQQGPEENQGERRTSTRFRISAPALATVRNREIWAFTRDISARAFYFRTSEEENLPLGEILDFIIKIPPTMSLSKPCFIKGRGRTIRVEDIDGELGVAVEILEYDIESERAHENADGRTGPDA